jgi:hypothetical protein
MLNCSTFPSSSLMARPAAAHARESERRERDRERERERERGSRNSLTNGHAKRPQKTLV